MKAGDMLVCNEVGGVQRQRFPPSPMPFVASLVSVSNLALAALYPFVPTSFTPSYLPLFTPSYPPSFVPSYLLLFPRRSYPRSRLIRTLPPRSDRRSCLVRTLVRTTFPPSSHLVCALIRVPFTPPFVPRSHPRSHLIPAFIPPRSPSFTPSFAACSRPRSPLVHGLVHRSFTPSYLLLEPCSHPLHTLVSRLVRTSLGPPFALTSHPCWDLIRTLILNYLLTCLCVYPDCM